MDHREREKPQLGKIEEGDILAKDVERRGFLRMGMFAATGLTGLTAGCGFGDVEKADQDFGDSVDADSTDPVDEDTGDPSDTDG